MQEMQSEHKSVKTCRTVTGKKQKIKEINDINLSDNQQLEQETMDNLGDNLGSIYCFYL